MTEPTAELSFESWVVFLDAQQTEIRANLRSLNRHLVVFEFYTLDTILRSSEVLSEFKILYHGTLVYSGRALVRNLINTGPTTLCEATLDDAWVDLDVLAPSAGSDLLARYHLFFQKHQPLHFLRPEFAAAVAGLRNYLSDVRLWLDHVAIGLRVPNEADRSRVEQETALKVAEPIIATIDNLFERFEMVAQDLPEELQPACHAYAQRQVRHLLLDAPFVFRTFRKPLGYAGDYKMVAMMFGDELDGRSLFARVLNKYSLSLPPICAHRNRIDYLAEQLQQEALGAMRKKHRLRVYNLGCGPAREIQQFMADSAASDHVDFTLVDFNQETLDHAREKLEAARTTNRRQTGLEFVRKSVQQVLKESVRRGSRPVKPPTDSGTSIGKHDLVYCAGLFDYLSNSVCRHLMEVFWRMVTPGGLLIATNVDGHPSRAQMECFLEWNLIYRDTAGMRKLTPASAKPDNVALKRDLTGVNLFLEIRKSEHDS